MTESITKEQGELAIQVSALYQQLLCVMKECEQYWRPDSALIRSLDTCVRTWQATNLDRHLAEAKKVYEKENRQPELRDFFLTPLA